MICVRLGRVPVLKTDQTVESSCGSGMPSSRPCARARPAASRVGERVAFGIGDLEIDVGPDRRLVFGDAAGGVPHDLAYGQRYFVECRAWSQVFAPQRAIRPAGSMSGTVELMSVQPARHPDPAEPYEVIHLGGETAAIVPLAELRRLRAVERHASREALEEAEIESTLAAHDEWVAAGCPGARSHEDVMAELLGSDQ